MTDAPDINATAQDAFDDAMTRIEIAHKDFDARKACARLLAEKLMSAHVWVRTDSEHFHSRPDHW